jgi:hypothetical protein
MQLIGPLSGDFDVTVPRPRRVEGGAFDLIRPQNCTLRSIFSNVGRICSE